MQQFSEEQIMNDPNAIIYDPSGGDNYEDTTGMLPDVNDINNEIIEMLEYACSDDIIKMKKKSHTEYANHMRTQFHDFSERYYGVFEMLIAGDCDSIDPLIHMLGAINEINKGNSTLKQAEESIGDELNEKYIYKNMSETEKTKVKKTIQEKYQK